MDNLIQRNYYKLFTGTNETKGSEKIHLGYEAEVSEIVLKKNNATFFHIPYFTTTQKLSSGQLIGSGATPGPIPAMADRIYKKRGNYGNTTPWGTTTDIPDGTWLCSWLYSLSGETPKWLDRFYNPGKVSFANALLGEPTFESYTVNNPIYQDVLSTISLEPGAWYFYYHCGEQTAQDVVKTFAGPLSSNLKLDIQTWSENTKDESIYENKVYIKNFKNSWALELKEPDVINRNTLNFKNNDFIDARVSYSNTYNLENEFTLNFWVQNDDWTSAPSTQLVGNLNNGGYGIFYNNLKYYPFFVVPETFYGHLYYYNQEGYNYLDKSTQPIVAELTATSLSSPKQVNINGEHEALILDIGGANSFYKVNHLGDTLTVPRLSSGELYITSGTPKQFIIDKNNQSLFQTTEYLYLFDSNLTYLGISAIPYIENANFALQKIKFSYNTGVKIVPNTYTISPTAITTNGNGVSATLAVKVNSLSAIESIDIIDGGELFSLNEKITINNSIYPATGLPNLSLTATSVGFGGKFVYNINGDFVKQSPCQDIKFDNNNQKWLIDNNNILTCNSIQLTGVQNCTNIGIDPNNNIWVLYNTNDVAIIDATTKKIIQNFNIGSFEGSNTKNISFIYSYDRLNDIKKWYCLIYCNFDKTLYQVTLDGKIKYSYYLPDNTNIEQAPPNLQDKNLMNFDSYGDFTGYEWKRIFNQVLYNNNPQLQFKIVAKKPIRGTPLKTFTVSIPVQYLSNSSWHLITGIFKNQTLSLYVDTRLRDSLILPGNYNVNYLRKNDLFIGTPAGKFDNLNKELNSQSLIFNGYIDNIKIYDYGITPSFLNMFVRSQYVAQNIYWNIPTTSIQYIETIERFFKHKAPGSKSVFFKIKLSGLEITDTNTRAVIESTIRDSIYQIKPAYAELIAIEWV